MSTSDKVQSMQTHRARDLVERFFSGLEARDAEEVAATLDPDAVIDEPFSADPAAGDGPAQRFEGREHAMSYFTGIITAFVRVAFTDRRTTVADNGTVFVETRGDLALPPPGPAYRNVYVFKFEVVDDRIRVITCYANPVIFIDTFPDLAAEQFHVALTVVG